MFNDMEDISMYPLREVNLQGLPNEILCSILDNLLYKDGLALAMTSRNMSARVLPRLYMNDVQAHIREGVPFALQFSCWFGRLQPYVMSIMTIEKACRSPDDLINRLFDVSNLNRFSASRGVVTMLDYGINSAAQTTFCTLLHLCSLRGSTAIAEALIFGGAKLECTDTKGNTPIHYAANESVAAFMLEHGAIIDGDIEKNPQGPLVSLIRIHYLQRRGRIATPSKWHSAAYSVGTDGVRKFGDMTPNTLSTFHYLVKSGVEVSPRLSDPRRLPLAHAVHSRQAAIVKALLDAGADPNPTYAVNGRPETYLFLTEALNHSTPEIAHLLLDAGALVDETPGSSQEAPIMALSCLPTGESHYLLLADRISQRMEDINRLIKGQTALWWAIKNGKFSVAKHLIRRGASWGAKGIFLRGKIVESLLQALG